MQNRHQYVQLLCVLLRGWEYIKVWYIARQVLIEWLPRRINRFAVPYLRNITFQMSVNTASVSPKNWPNVQILWIINSYTTLIVCLFSDTCKYCIVSTSSQWREAGGLGPAPTKRRKQMRHRTEPQRRQGGLWRPPRPTEGEMGTRWCPPHLWNFLLTLEFQVASIKHKNNNKQTSRKLKEETPPAPVVEEDTKEEKAKLVSDIIYSFISSEIVRTLLHIFICTGTYFRTAAAGTDHSEPGQHHGPTEESQDQPGSRQNHHNE